MIFQARLLKDKGIIDYNQNYWLIFVKSKGSEYCQKIKLGKLSNKLHLIDCPAATAAVD